MMLQNIILSTFFGDRQYYNSSLIHPLSELDLEGDRAFLDGRVGSLNIALHHELVPAPTGISTSLFIPSSRCTSARIRIRNCVPLQGKLLLNVFNRILPFKKTIRSDLC